MTDAPFPVSQSSRDFSRWPTRLALVLLFAVGGLAVAWGIGAILPPNAGEESAERATAMYLGFGLAAVAFFSLMFLRRVERPLVGAMAELADRVDALSRPARDRELLVASALGLFLEVLLIRWQGTELLVASYFKNVTLIASFLGLGLGFAATEKRRMSLAVAPLLLAAQVLVIAFLDWRGADAMIRHPASGEEWIWGIALVQQSAAAPSPGADPRFWLQIGVFYGFFAALFISTILIFIPIGQITGRLMRGLPSIRAYTVNIFGSLAGVVLFGLVSYLWLAPPVWFGLTAVMFLFLLRHERIGAFIGGLCLLVTVLAAGNTGRLDARDVYSPYQRLQVTPLRVFNDKPGESLDIGVEIAANKAYHLRAANLAADFVAAHGKQFPLLEKVARVYDLPYDFVGKLPGSALTRAQRVLVVGAGGGNDVAAALRAGPTRVDAVEIDPAIYELGRIHHPEHPYDSPKVNVQINDARAFMRRAQGGVYDLAVFGLLDSHTLLSGMSAVRLDNFVYTRESIAEARRLLKDDGVLALSFAAGTGGYLATRLYNIITDVFGHPPDCFSTGYDAGMMYIVGRSDKFASAIPAADPRRCQVVARSPGTELTDPADSGRAPRLLLERDVAPSTDDWPFLYLRGRLWSQIPQSYFVMVAMLALISIVWVLIGSSRRTGFSPHFFFLGGAFLLIEVKGITELALVYGTTWVVSSVVIAGILLLILFANLFVTMFSAQNRAIHYVLLAACLLTGYFVPLEKLLTYGFWPAAIGATALLLVPLFFAGVIFATSLKQAASLPRVFASNLLGAILGGLCEYSSMALGFRNMYLLGLALYALSFLTMPRGRGAAGGEGGASADGGSPERVELPDLAAGESPA